MYYVLLDLQLAIYDDRSRRLIQAGLARRGWTAVPGRLLWWRAVDEALPEEALATALHDAVDVAVEVGLDELPAVAMVGAKPPVVLKDVRALGPRS